MRLTYSRIKFLEHYASADRQTFDRFLDLLNGQGHSLGNVTKGLPGFMPRYQKALWTPAYPELLDLKSPNRIHGRIVVHHAIHTLIACRFGSQLRGRPRLAMLTEGMAGAIELYFQLQFVRSGGNPSEGVEMSFYTESSKELRRGFVKKFNSMVKDPFKAFRENALCSYEISMQMLELLHKAAEGKPFSTERIYRQIKNSDQYLFLYHKDFPNFALFTSAYCGYRSSPTDLRNFKHCLKVLKTSSSMDEFLEKLDIYTFLESKKMS